MTNLLDERIGQQLMYGLVMCGLDMRALSVRPILSSPIPKYCQYYRPIDSPKCVGCNRWIAAMLWRVNRIFKERMAKTWQKQPGNLMRNTDI